MARTEFRFRTAGRLGAMVLKGLGHTLRVRVERDEPLLQFRRDRQPVIFTFWHDRILPLAYLHRNEGIVVLVSQHGDGEYVARTIEQMGFGTARGSSTRGGARGLRGLVHAAREGHDLAFTPDGPRGPRRRFKAGALVAAQLTGAPLLPLAAGGEGIWRLKSWDRMVVPKPFAEITLKYDRPYFIPRSASGDDLVAHAIELEGILNRLTDEVDDVRVAEGGGSPQTLPSGQGSSERPG